MLYYGYFRSIDTSIDKKGQKYKVEIFTDFSNPYPEDRLNPYDPTQPIPNEGIELTMTSQPFIVDYTNENGDLYKPYKCSTASVSFLMSNYNNEFFTSNANKIMVALLKERHDLYKNGNRLYNGDGDSCREYSIDISATESILVYRPSEYDRVAYNVEWIGFATPNSLNQNYSLIKQPFTLECQDAFSTLQYRRTEIDYINGINSVLTIIRNLLNNLGTYKNIYITSSLRVPDVINTSFLRRIIFNTNNFRDEEKDKNRFNNDLEVLEELAKLLNLTFVPYHNNIYILQYDGLEHQYYYHYKLSSDTNNFYFNINNSTWNNEGETLLYDEVELNAESFSRNDTNLSVNPIYSKILVEHSENQTNLLPDLRILSDYYDVINENTPGSHTSSGGNGQCTFKSGITSSINKKGLKTIGYTYYYIGGEVVWIETNNYTLSLNQLVGVGSYSSGCVFLRDASLSAKNLRLNSPIFEKKYGGVFFFYKPDATNNATYLKFESPYLLLNYAKSIELTGTWEFFRNQLPINIEAANDLIGSNPPDDNFGVEVDYTKCNIKAKISASFDNNNIWWWNGSNWVQNETYCTLNIYNYDEERKEYNINIKSPFGQPMSFEKSNPNSNGLVISLDSFSYLGSDTMVKFNIEFYNPIGCAVNSSSNVVKARSAILSNFGINIRDNRLTSAWGYEFYDSIFSTVENENYVENIKSIQCKTSSNKYTNNMDWGYVDRLLDDNGEISFYSVNNISNMSTGLCTFPEYHILANQNAQYTVPSIEINTSVFHDILKPWTNIKWSSQFPTYNFILDCISMDYELNSDTVVLVDKKRATEIPEIDLETYLEGDNGKGIIKNPLVENNDFIDSSFSTITIENDDNVYCTLSYNLNFREKGTLATTLFTPRFKDNNIYGMCYTIDENFLYKITSVEIDENGELIINTR